MSTTFRIRALDPGYLDTVRARGKDDFGNDVVVMTNVDAGGTPLRCCLREAAVGEKVVLIAHRAAPIGGPYVEVGPIFIHAERCAGYETTRSYPHGFRQRQLVFRAYDARGRQVENRIAEGGAAAEGVIDGLLSKPEVAYLHARNVLAGCFMFTVERGP